MTEVTLVPLAPDDREQFIRDNQEAFNYGALEEFGLRDDHFEEDGEIISRETIDQSIDGGEAYRIMQDGQPVGGVVIRVNGKHGDLDLLFVSPRVHSKGIGYAAWRAVERLHPEVTVWETVTPYFEKRNIHFYVNRCGFHIVEFFNSHHPDPNEADQIDEQFPDGMFRFEKRMEGSREADIQ
jgi:GNAT superfamily N-acetyltransferase